MVVLFNSVEFGLDMGEYLGADGVSSSMVRAVLRDPEWGVARLVFERGGEFTRRSPGEAARVGSLLHSVLVDGLRPVEWTRTKDLDSKGAREYRAANPGDLLLGHDDYVLASECLSALLARRDFPILEGEGDREVSLFWTDKHTGIELKARPDIVLSPEATRTLGGDGALVVDLKTTGSIREFKRDWAAKWFYHVQAAFYLEGVKAAGLIAKHTPTRFAFWVVENHAPYLSCLFLLPPVSHQVGRWLMYEGLDKIRGGGDTYWEQLIELKTSEIPTQFLYARANGELI